MYLFCDILSEGLRRILSFFLPVADEGSLAEAIAHLLDESHYDKINKWMYNFIIQIISGDEYSSTAI